MASANIAADLSDDLPAEDDATPARAATAPAPSTGAQVNEPTARYSADTPAPAAAQVSATSTSSVAQRGMPHAGDGIVSNEALMATAGAAPSVSPVIPDSAAAAPAPSQAPSLSESGQRTHVPK